MEWRRFVTYLSNDPRIKSDVTAAAVDVEWVIGCVVFHCWQYAVSMSDM